MLPLSARANDSTALSPDIIHTYWYCSAEKLNRNVAIYIPEGQGPFPVLYLLHGINGFEGSWLEQGDAAEILAQQIEQGLCPPMILVMPDCNKWPYKVHPGNKNLWRYLLRYSRISKEHEIEYSISELMDKIDTTYNVSDFCAVAGLSDGARIAANVANLRPDCIRTVGLFSPVLHKEQLPQDTTKNYSVYIGKKDIFKGSGKRFHKKMCKAGYRHQFVELEGSHNWRMWRNCLAHFLGTMPQTNPEWSSLSADDPNIRFDSDSLCNSVSAFVPGTFHLFQ